jgi:hypothetical protein
MAYVQNICYIQKKKFNVSKRELKKHNFLKFTLMFVIFLNALLYMSGLKMRCYIFEKNRCAYLKF